MALAVPVVLLLVNNFAGPYVSPDLQAIANIILIVILSLAIIYFALRSRSRPPDRPGRKPARDRIARQIMHRIARRR
ncbi:MAG: hypothetical protein FJ191_10830 [Gammaproteobacteria bacterium]|nr:hypothetical protein [Gammaproteobacteria bacterium]